MVFINGEVNGLRKGVRPPFAMILFVRISVYLMLGNVGYTIGAWIEEKMKVPTAQDETATDSKFSTRHKNR